MTKGEAKKLETDTAIFPVDLKRENQITILIAENSGDKTLGKSSIKIDAQLRFTRLKRSLRKRSASIL
jgi:hypothetical protein